MELIDWEKWEPRKGRGSNSQVGRSMARGKQGDLATVLSLMADDVIFMVRRREPFGKEAAFAASNFADGSS